MTDYEQERFPKKRTLITCHHNADFDALTSLVGVSLFFPDAQLVFPGTQEKNVQEFFDDVAQPLFGLIAPKDADYENIERLVVVDTQTLERISHIKPLLEKHGLLDDEALESNSSVANHEEHIQSLSNDSATLEILIWDHHPSGDITADGGKSDLVGSASTLICEEIKSTFHKIPCEFANVLALGIYVDTGSFSYTSTTPRDYYASAWLLEQGFSPDFVIEYTHRSMSKEHLSVLNDLVESSQFFEYAGIRFVIASARLDYYLNDFASLMPQFLDLNPCHVVFALASMKNAVQVVARSKEDSIDVGKVCTLLGGGGHPYAAAAMVKDKTLSELIDFIHAQISLITHKDKTAKRLMTAPPVIVHEYDTIAHAETIMAQFGFKAIPVCKDKTKICVGWLEHQLALKAITHGLGSVTVTAYMNRRFRMVTPDTGLQTLMDIVVGERQRLIPVVDDSGVSKPTVDVDNQSNEAESDKYLQDCPIIGLITRTDLIRIFLDDNQAQLPSPRSKTPRKKNVAKMLKLFVPPACVRILELAGQLASERGVHVYVVGGFVRDLLMDNHKMRWPGMDVDLVVEGDAIAFARDLATLLKGRVKEHAEFLTALLIFNSKTLEKSHFEEEVLPRISEVNNVKDIEEAVETLQSRLGHQASTEQKIQKNKKEKIVSDSASDSIKEKNQEDFEIRIDVATARLEYYQSPAALPTVELSSIRMDLTRRDFSINAMAIQLNSEVFGELVDFFDGQNDIKQKHIRVLHALSFVEDPTRSLRAIRFEQRYGFKLSHHCDKLIKNSVELGLIDKLSGKRIVTELNIIFKESDPLACFDRLQEFNLFSAIHPILDIGLPEKRHFIDECYKVLDWYKLLYLEEEVNLLNFFIFAMCRSSSTHEVEELLHRLDFIDLRIKEILRVRSQLIQAIPKLESWMKSELRMSELHDILRNIPIEALLFLVARAPYIADENLKKHISLYVYKTRLETIAVRGQDIINLGVSKGPLIGKILKDVLDAKMNEEINGYDEEINYAEQRLHFYRQES